MNALAPSINLPAVVPRIDEALRDGALLGAALGPIESWTTWLVALRAAFGIQLSEDELAIFAEIAGGRQPPQRRVKELIAILGRRSGKSRIAAAVGTYFSVYSDAVLAPGEVGYVLVLAASKDQAKAVLGYIEGYFAQSPILAPMVEEVTADEIRLKGNVIIAVHTNSFRTVRGRTLLACIFDEAGFWRDETSTNPDVEVYSAILPALATSNGMLIVISSPWRRAGLLHLKHQASFGRDGDDVLVLQGRTQLFNPTIADDVIERTSELDPEGARSEWGGEFRDDVSDYIDRKALMACVDMGVHERPPLRVHSYTAAVDPSGGGKDSMTMAVAHKEGTTVVLDCLREIRPGRGTFSPESIVSEFAAVLRTYRVSSVKGDRYGGEWPKSMFRTHGINYEFAETSTAENYINALPLLNSGAAALLDHERSLSQIANLERRPMRGGRDRVEHPRNGHDDLAAVVALALVTANRGRATRSDWDAKAFEIVPMEDPLAGF